MFMVECPRLSELKWVEVILCTFRFDIPDGDVLVVAGDFTLVGDTPGVRKFDRFMASQPHRHKVAIAGNHELTFDLKISDELFQRRNNRKFRRRLGLTVEGSRIKWFDPRSLLKSCIYLEDELINIQGVNIYGSPWQPEFHGWAFNLLRGEALAKKWRMIPDLVDVLITHGPPVGHKDWCVSGDRAGCVDLLLHVSHRIRPRFHVFGHIHEDYGCTSDGFTTFVNASTCDKQYVPVNQPIVFDVRIPTCCDRVLCDTMF